MRSTLSLVKQVERVLIANQLTVVTNEVLVASPKSALKERDIHSP
jgi:hypothetical protein